MSKIYSGLTYIAPMKSIFILAILVLTFSCDRPNCKNENTIFDQFAPDSREYKDELARQLQKTDETELTYWFDQYELKGDKEYINIHIQGNDLCAKGLVLVEEWKGLEGIRKTKGISYRGAQLAGFEMDIVENSSGTEFIFKNIDYIID